MEAVILVALGALGYSLSQGGKKPRKTDKLRNDVPLNEDPYVNKKLKDVIKTEQDLADARFKKAKDPYNNNVVIGAFLAPEKLVEQNQTILPIKNTQDAILGKYKENKIGNIINDNSVDGNGGNTFESFSPAPSLGGAIGLTGDPKNPSEFTHNNMVPFFGGNLKGNSVPEKSHIMEQHTGLQNRWKEPKKAVERFVPLYKEQVNGNVPFQDTISRDRYIQSTKKQGVLPFPQERTHYIEPEYVRPQYKNVDNLRVKQKAAIEYKGRIIPGQKEVQRQRDIENFTRNRSDITSSKNILIPTSTDYKEARTRITRDRIGDSLDSHDSRDVCKESYEADSVRNLQQSTRGAILPLNEDTRPTIKQTTHSGYIGGVGKSEINTYTSRDGKYIMKEKNAESTQYDGISRSQYSSSNKEQVSRKQYENKHDRTDKECLLENRIPNGYIDKSSDASTVHLSRYGNRDDKTVYIPQGNQLVQKEYAQDGLNARENYNIDSLDQSSQRISDASLIVKQLESNPFSLQ